MAHVWYGFGTNDSIMARELDPLGSDSETCACKRFSSSVSCNAMSDLREVLCFCSHVFRSKELGQRCEESPFIIVILGRRLQQPRRVKPETPS